MYRYNEILDILDHLFYVVTLILFSNASLLALFLLLLIDFLFIHSLLPNLLESHQLTDICLSKREKKRCIILQEGEIFLTLAEPRHRENIFLIL